MRSLIAILALAGLLCIGPHHRREQSGAQPYWHPPLCYLVQWGDEWTVPNQREFAQKCYEFGKQYGRGHTLVALAWMESSLGRDTNHGEASFGPFGISHATYRVYQRSSGIWNQTDIRDNGDSFEPEARMAIQIFKDNIGYFLRLGYSPGTAWYNAAAMYNGGFPSEEREGWKSEDAQEYARKFNERVAFLKTQFK